MKYRKTALIEAEQYIGSPAQIIEYNIVEIPPVIGTNKPYEYFIPTLEGPMELHAGDWIATGVNGEHWAIADDVFKKTYEPAEDSCRFCHSSVGRKDIPDEYLTAGTYSDGYIDPTTNELVVIGIVNNIDDCNFRTINYCPMCGRRLSDVFRENYSAKPSIPK